MPIFKFAEKTFYFAHVPKCAGTSVEDYLMDRFGTLSFLNRKYHKKKDSIWCKSSPQHLLASDLGSLFQADFFDITFAVVRHPVSRIISAFHFQRDWERKIPKSTSLSDWIDRLQDFGVNDHRIYDNHFQQQTAFLPKKCNIFKMEDGLIRIESWLDEVTNTTHHGNIPKSLSGKYNKPEVTEDTIAKIENFYYTDFVSLGYNFKYIEKVAP